MHPCRMGLPSIGVNIRYQVEESSTKVPTDGWSINFMNGEILILSIVKDRTAGVTKTPKLFPDMMSNIHFQVLWAKHQVNNLKWYSKSKSTHKLVHEMDSMYVKNCLNLLITGQGQWKAPLSSVAESIRQAWIAMFEEELYRRSK